jgi:hypothetical protein
MNIDAFIRSQPLRSQSTSNSFVEGECHSVTAEGMYFTIDGWDEGKYVFGPAPWPTSRVDLGPDAHDHSETVPTAGDRVLVLFLGGGVERPWVLGWWP